MWPGFGSTPSQTQNPLSFGGQQTQQPQATPFSATQQPGSK
jgi:hypothetical protein